ncbi:hypothetical protein SDC9_32697 [bioreactor metagenome]|uniref:DUF4129 domain-containing protein n=1 Tax=bioreactor metagenome TaxID=1076179 RepID=A0A644V6B2_9ZZZZ|nr:hypothetical protein [Methanocorpusculum sp.]
MTHAQHKFLTTKRSGLSGIVQRSAVLLLILTLFLAGGFSCSAAAEEAEPVQTNGAAAELSALAAALNSTAASLKTGDPRTAAAEIGLISADLDNVRTVLAGTPLASSEVQDLIRIKNRLDTSAADLLIEDPDTSAAVSALTEAKADVSAVSNTLTTTYAWARQNQEDYGSDLPILETSLLGLAAVSLSLENTTASLAAGSPDIAAAGGQLSRHIDDLSLIRDRLAADSAPAVLTDELNMTVASLGTAADSLQNGGDLMTAADMISSAAVVLVRLSADTAALPTTTPTEPPAETPTPTVTMPETTMTVVPTQTNLVETPTPEVIIPDETEGDGGAGFLAPVIIGVLGLILIVAGLFIYLKKPFGRKKIAELPTQKSADHAPEQKEERFVPVPSFSEKPDVAEVQKQPAEPEQTQTLPPAAEQVSSPEPKTRPVSPDPNAAPAEQFRLVAAQIAKIRGIQTPSEALTPRELIDLKKPSSLIEEYVTLYEKVRYSPGSAPEDNARLAELAARILKENT